MSPDAHKKYAEQWHVVQRVFVDDPSGAVDEADRLVTEVMRERGYPVDDFDQRASDISVDHPDTVEHYRAAHTLYLAQEKADIGTEAQRQAFVHYRALFEQLLGADQNNREELAKGGAGMTTHDQRAATAPTQPQNLNSQARERKRPDCLMSGRPIRSDRRRRIVAHTPNSRKLGRCRRSGREPAAAEGVPPGADVQPSGGDVSRRVATSSRRAHGSGNDAQPSGDQLLFATDTSGLRSRWDDIQAAFVDDPTECVQKADALVEEVVEQLTAGFSEARSRLEAQWARGEHASTEDLRVALQRYREFFQRLLAV